MEQGLNLGDLFGDVQNGKKSIVELQLEGNW